MSVNVHQKRQSNEYKKENSNYFDSQGDPKPKQFLGLLLVSVHF